MLTSKRIRRAPPAYPSLKEWRQALRIDQSKAAAHLGLSIGYYSRLENRLMHPHRKKAKLIAERTGVPIETVLGL